MMGGAYLQDIKWDLASKLIVCVSIPRGIGCCRMSSAINCRQCAPTKDCLHFCMNSAALNVYLDYYQAEVFS